MSHIFVYINKITCFQSGFMMSGSKLSKTHAQAQHSCCVACGSGRAKLALTPVLKKLIKEFAQPTYNSAVELFPRGCCVTCKYSIYACKKAVAVQKPVEPQLNFHYWHLVSSFEITFSLSVISCLMVLFEEVVTLLFHYIGSIKIFIRVTPT